MLLYDRHRTAVYHVRELWWKYNAWGNEFGPISKLIRSVTDCFEDTFYGCHLHPLNFEGDAHPQKTASCRLRFRLQRRGEKSWILTVSSFTASLPTMPNYKIVTCGLSQRYYCVTRYDTEAGYHPTHGKLLVAEHAHRCRKGWTATLNPAAKYESVDDAALLNVFQTRHFIFSIRRRKDIKAWCDFSIRTKHLRRVFDGKQQRLIAALLLAARWQD